MILLVCERVNLNECFVETLKYLKSVLWIWNSRNTFCFWKKSLMKSNLVRLSAKCASFYWFLRFAKRCHSMTDTISSLAMGKCFALVPKPPFAVNWHSLTPTSRLMPITYWSNSSSRINGSLCLPGWPRERRWQVTVSLPSRTFPWTCLALACRGLSSSGTSFSR